MNAHLSNIRNHSAGGEGKAQLQLRVEMSFLFSIIYGRFGRFKTFILLSVQQWHQFNRSSSWILDYRDLSRI